MGKTIHNYAKKNEVNYIPDEAIKISEKAKNPPLVEEKKADLSVKNRDSKKDPFSQERVSPNQPSAKEVKTTIPDDTVLPG